MGHDSAIEDAALVRQIAAGDARAEATLSQRLFPRIRAYGLRHLRDRSATADLGQHVVIVVIEAIRAGRVEQPERLAAFVMGTCRNTVRDWSKGERRRAELLDRYGITNEFVETSTARLDARAIDGCVQQLDVRARTILALSFYADLDCDAIASELSMTANNVRVVRHRALKQLHDCVTGGA